MKPAQLAWWDATLSKVVRAPEWTAFVRQKQWSPDYRDSGATAKFFAAETKQYAAVLKQLGLLTKSVSETS